MRGLALQNVGRLSEMLSVTVTEPEAPQQLYCHVLPGLLSKNSEVIP